MNTGVITLLKDFFFEIQPHINGHKTAMGKFFKALEILESKPQSEPLPDSNFEQDFKELSRYLDILCQRGHNVKDSGHLWIEFTDKFNAFEKRVLAAASTVSEPTDAELTTMCMAVSEKSLEKEWAEPLGEDAIECSHPFKEVSQKSNNFYCNSCKDWI